VSDPRAALRRELDRWCACKRFRYQFSLIATRQPRAQKRKGGDGDRGAWKPRLWRPTPIRPPKLGLAAVKHAQQLAARAAQAEQQGRAFVALAHVVADTGGGWPEAMQRELHACKTPQDRQAWEARWGGYLGGEAQRANVLPAPLTRNPHPS
jgi:hypothetical protein